jgi:hypothetical protein
MADCKQGRATMKNFDVVATKGACVIDMARGDNCVRKGWCVVGFHEMETGLGRKTEVTIPMGA